MAHRHGLTPPNPGRVAAARALLAVEDGEHAEDALAAGVADLQPRDRALAWTITFGALRKRATVDAALNACLSRAVGELDPPLRAVLRAGGFEALFLRSPRRAVVSDGVGVARELKAGRGSGLVNAVLRRVEQPARLDRVTALDHPAWLVQRWTARYGAEATDAWCYDNGEPPPLFIGARDPDTARALWVAAGSEVPWRIAPAHIRGDDVPGAFRVEGWSGPVDQLPGWDEAGLWVQDVASAWVTDLVPTSAARVLDATAAPGGKTARLAARGAQVAAVDVSASRLALLRDAMIRLRFDVPTLQHDWLKGRSDALGTFDAVLVDAPCTGLGTVRRHPEIRWRRGPMDPAGMTDRQLRVTKGAAHHVRPGGHLVYIVCSAEPEEGPAVVAELVKLGWRVEEERCSAPPVDDEDAFYGARLVRA